jgi:hypothetical protein
MSNRRQAIAVCLLPASLVLLASGMISCANNSATGPTSGRSLAVGKSNADVGDTTSRSGGKNGVGSEAGTNKGHP